jgi:hypothetical protein
MEFEEAVDIHISLLPSSLPESLPEYSVAPNCGTAAIYDSSSLKLEAQVTPKHWYPYT